MLDIDHSIIELDSGTKLLKSSSDTPNKGIILHLHGLPGGPFDENKTFNELLATRGYQVFSFNYPGLWKANGTFTIDNSVSATIEVYNYLDDEYEGTPKIFAESFGGTMIVKAISSDIQPTHVFYRAPLPGLQYFTKNQQMMSQLLTSFAMLVQSGVVNIPPDAGIEQILGDHGSPIPFREEFSEVLSNNESFHFVVTGKNDEILDYRAIEEGYQGAEMKIFDNLSHNSISRSQWIEIITLADIFYQR